MTAESRRPFHGEVPGGQAWQCGGQSAGRRTAYRARIVSAAQLSSALQMDIRGQGRR